MKRLVSIAAMSAATTIMWSGTANAAELNMACAKAGEERFIQVISPGQVGQACDVRYTRDQGRNTSIPYHANNTHSYCDEKAAELLQNLMNAGYSCAPTTAAVIANIGKPIRVAPPLAAAPRAGSQVVAQAPVQITAPTPAPRPQRAVTQAAQTNVQPAVQSHAAGLSQPATPAPEPVVTEQASTLPATSSDVTPAIIQSTAPEMPIIAEAPEDEAVLEEKMSAILLESDQVSPSEPEEAAVRGPAQLTTQLTEPVALAKNTPAAGSSAVGRLVGATPVEPTQVLVADATEPLQTVTGVTNASVQSAAPEPAKIELRTPRKTARTVEEIIAATLDAQVAAWNEGNLEAFMDTYWNDDDLKFISGVTLTKGWSSTLKNYRERYSNGVGFGRLALEKTDVQMVTDDVAVITGRFHHTDNDASASGIFSLVMRRFDGLWRIVHDHTAQDPAAEE